MLDGTLYEALVARNAPERFAVDLTALLAGQVDFRRDLQGGETFALVWQEDQLPDGSIAGEPRLNYARLELADRCLNSLLRMQQDPSSCSRTGKPSNGQPRRSWCPAVVRFRATQPSSPRRRPDAHRIDYAAPIGTEVSATGAGRVVFAGTIRVTV